MRDRACSPLSCITCTNIALHSVSTAAFIWPVMQISAVATDLTVRCASFLIAPTPDGRSAEASVGWRALRSSPRPPCRPQLVWPQHVAGPTKPKLLMVSAVDKWVCIHPSCVLCHVTHIDVWALGRPFCHGTTRRNSAQPALGDAVVLPPSVYTATSFSFDRWTKRLNDDVVATWHRQRVKRHEY